MLVVKVEVWPGGDSRPAYEIARVGLANVSQLAPVSNYEMTALLDRNRSEYVLRAEVNSHERDLGWEPLVKRAVGNLLMTERMSQDVPYDDPVAELLRKGRHV